MRDKSATNYVHLQQIEHQQAEADMLSGGKCVLRGS